MNKIGLKLRNVDTGYSFDEAKRLFDKPDIGRTIRNGATIDF